MADQLHRVQVPSSLLLFRITVLCVRDISRELSDGISRCHRFTVKNHHTRSGDFAWISRAFCTGDPVLSTKYPVKMGTGDRVHPGICRVHHGISCNDIVKMFSRDPVEVQRDCVNFTGPHPLIFPRDRRRLSGIFLVAT